MAAAVSSQELSIPSTSMMLSVYCFRAEHSNDVLSPEEDARREKRSG
jgi:hypothetical protein